MRYVDEDHRLKDGLGFDIVESDVEWSVDKYGYVVGKIPLPDGSMGGLRVLPTPTPEAGRRRVLAALRLGTIRYVGTATGGPPA